ncbi:hypothetical protein OIO90_004288 [Microbotryomycetes sp. JL221]|nr:hypothetical protein OIO90_004288 [Microbotryomycetes sp. JL221]
MKSKDSSLQGQSLFSRQLSLQRHVLFGLTISCDLVICALAIFLYLKSVWLPLDPEKQVWYSRLPTFASVVGSAITGLNAWCLALIISAHAKRLVLHQGITLHQLESYSLVANGSYPRGVSTLLIFALTTMLAKAFLPSSLVQSLTPSLVLDSTTMQMPYISFSAGSFQNNQGQPDIQCQYGLTYGYGFQCPINNRFGVMYDAGVQVFTDTVPVNYTRQGVTYPNALSGLSGSISTLATDAYRLLVKNPNAIPTPNDVMKTCVPRAIVSTTCQPFLRTGWQTQNFRTDLNQLRQPAGVTNFTLIDNQVIFGKREPELNGMSTIFILNTGQYNQDFGSSTIECNVTVVEEQISIKILGGTNVEKDENENSCQELEQPDSDWLPNLTFLSQMVLQKQQGQDGRLESVMLFEPTEQVSRIDKIQEAVTRMVSVGATEMYANLYNQLTNTSSVASFPNQTYYYGTPRLRLGNSTWQSLLFLLAPLFFMIVLLLGWFAWGLRRAGSLKFDPLNNAATTLAGINSFSIDPQVKQECVCDMDRATKSLSHLKFRFAKHSKDLTMVGLTNDDMALLVDRQNDKKSLFGSSMSMSLNSGVGLATAWQHNNHNNKSPMHSTVTTPTAGVYYDPMYSPHQQGYGYQQQSSPQSYVPLPVANYHP